MGLVFPCYGAITFLMDSGLEIKYAHSIDCDRLTAQSANILNVHGQATNYALFCGENMLAEKVILHYKPVSRYEENPSRLVDP